LSDSIKTAGESNKDISQKIEEIKNIIAQFEEFILQNCNDPNIDSKTVSDKLEYLRTKIVPLRVNIEKFVSKLKPKPACANSLPCKPGYTKDEITCDCSCSYNCDNLIGEVINFEYCQCENFPISAEIYKIETKLHDYIYRLSTVSEQPDYSTELIHESYDLITDMTQYIGSLQWQWEEIPLEEKTSRIEAYIARGQDLSAKIDSYLISTKGSCEKDCGFYAIQKYDCTCFESEEASTQLNIFMERDRQFDEYSRYGIGDLNLVKELIASSAGVRKDIGKFIEFVKNGNDQGSIDDYLNTITAEIKALTDGWDAYILSFQGPPEAPPSECTVNCQGDTVRNKKPCTCFDVENWVRLNSEVKNGIEQLRQDAAGLTIDQTNKDTLESNLKQLDDGIPDLVSYTNNFDLDEDYVKARCHELVSLYLKTFEDIKALKEGKSTVLCDVTCPNYDHWVYTSVKCSCTCPEKSCMSPNQFDPYKCDCVPKNNKCNLTKENCASYELLDYTNCECKSRP
jgi:hypothetical protein